MSPTSTPFRPRRIVGIAVGVAALTGLAACGSSSGSATNGAAATTAAPAATTAAPSVTTAGGSMADDAMAPSGPGCSGVPANGAGSFSGMAADPAATAASNNPVLSTLVAAVTKAALVDTLNGPGPFTIFAPANSAFDKIPAATLNAVLADKAKLTDILTYHVIAGQKLSSKQLEDMGQAMTVEGKPLIFTNSNSTLLVNGVASGVCVDVPTDNATVHIIDTVLMPPTS
jgi:uncharacterized surface protein with fasciclin (FAS1) repeats